MIRKPEDQRSFTRSPGVDIQALVESDQMYEAGRLFARITIAPGASLAYHRHDDEMESFYVLKGTCRIQDNNETAYLTPGDVLITPTGQAHSVTNESTESVELIALIISCKQGVPGKGVPL